MKVERLDEPTLGFLMNGGWAPGRTVPDLVSEWEKSFFPAQGFMLTSPAREALLTLGGLAFHQAGVGERVARRSFRFDPTVAVGELDRFREFEVALGVTLSPVGNAEDGDMYLAVAEDGRVVCLMDDAWVIGDCIEGALSSLVSGRGGQVVHAS